MSSGPVWLPCCGRPGPAPGRRRAEPDQSYRDRFPELDAELLVALIYEEYCLREEAGEQPEAAEYEVRFPSLAGSFQEVMAIHDLVGGARVLWSRGVRTKVPRSRKPGERSPVAGCVEELGRGAFARVYLAEEQHLADRPVALKVTRTGSREPQTLARLPAHAYRSCLFLQTDPATGLHLLCMPYLGRTTLLQVLNRTEIQSVRSGADLLDLLDRMQPPESKNRSGGKPGRSSRAGPILRRSPGGRAHGRGPATRPRPRDLAPGCQALERAGDRRRPAHAARLQPGAGTSGCLCKRSCRGNEAVRLPTWLPNIWKQLRNVRPKRLTNVPTFTRWGWCSSIAWSGARGISPCLRG